MATGTILVINPNSNLEVTAGMAAALAGLALAGGPAIRCTELPDGPFGIESEADILAVEDLLAARVATDPADAFVIACYSDPGLARCRAATAKPVLGIGEGAMLTAMTRGRRFGVVAILEAAIPRHLRYIDELGIGSRLAAERALGLRVHELADEGRTWTRLVEVATALKERDRADVVILGCAGMGRYRGRLEAVLGVPVIDPVQAATGMAITALCSS
jgi:Asp/Glu/hydantoin racemase